ncbi:molybdate ABC transporter substrate-binding protein [Primorskyibacter aestuariivivens]|uniref:molybdate ABC transporter substrate-binding protein n=1 Tax=Primorskyibacter aestuariivivens TaxID=1888912 RepID=UPI002300083D|nr:molybdate ABC transporter substrate-binding protein [Primorskyibacter aestuariivivens]MDA7430819.1 molybdate ABC transporter substrate-binding protein [Primorskyibacter aestuariivivens]
MTGRQLDDGLGCPTRPKYSSGKHGKIQPMPLTRRHFLTASAAALATGSLAEGTAPVVAAAASLRFVLPVLVDAFARGNGGTIRLAFGSSGTLAQQIRNGAPFELFLSADERFVLGLATDGIVANEGSVYAVGRLAISAPTGSPLEVDADMAGLEAALAAGTLHRFAIASPEHAPYGMRAREALLHRGLWEAVEPKLVFGENVAQTAQFALSGNAEGGLIAGSLAMAAPFAARSRSALIPTEWHAPLTHRMVATARAGDVALAFRDFLLTEEAQEIFVAHGFAPREAG